MKNSKRKVVDPDMLPEYEFKNMVRGKYFGRYGKKSPVFLVPDKPKRRRSDAATKPLERAMPSKA